MNSSDNNVLNEKKVGEASLQDNNAKLENTNTFNQLFFSAISEDKDKVVQDGIDSAFDKVNSEYNDVDFSIKEEYERENPSKKLSNYKENSVVFAEKSGSQGNFGGEVNKEEVVSNTNLVDGNVGDFENKTYVGASSALVGSNIEENNSVYQGARPDGLKGENFATQNFGINQESSGTLVNGLESGRTDDRNNNVTVTGGNFGGVSSLENEGVRGSSEGFDGSLNVNLRMADSNILGQNNSLDNGVGNQVVSANDVLNAGLGSRTEDFGNLGQINNLSEGGNSSTVGGPNSLEQIGNSTNLNSLERVDGSVSAINNVTTENRLVNDSLIVNGEGGALAWGQNSSFSNPDGMSLDNRGIDNSSVQIDGATNNVNFSNSFNNSSNGMVGANDSVGTSGNSPVMPGALPVNLGGEANNNLGNSVLNNGGVLVTSGSSDNTFNSGVNLSGVNWQPMGNNEVGGLNGYSQLGETNNLGQNEANFDNVQQSSFTSGVNGQFGENFNDNFNNSYDDSGNKRSKKGSKLLIGLVILIIIIVGVGFLAYRYLFAANRVFNNSVSEVFQLVYGLYDNEEESSFTFDPNTESLVINSNLIFFPESDNLKEDMQVIGNEDISSIGFNLGLGIDSIQRKMAYKIEYLENGNEVLGSDLLLDSEYMSISFSELYDKIIKKAVDEYNSEEIEQFFTEMLNYSTEEVFADESMKKMLSLTENIFITTIESMASNYIVKSEEVININDVDQKFYEYAYTLKNEEINKFMNLLYKNISNNDEYLQLLSDYLGTSKDDLKESIDSAIDSENYFYSSDDYEELTLAFYTEGFLNKFSGVSFEVVSKEDHDRTEMLFIASGDKYKLILDSLEADGKKNAKGELEFIVKDVSSGEEEKLARIVIATSDEQTVITYYDPEDDNQYISLGYVNKVISDSELGFTIDLNFSLKVEEEIYKFGLDCDVGVRTGVDISDVDFSDAIIYEEMSTKDKEELENLVLEKLESTFIYKWYQSMTGELLTTDVLDNIADEF